MFDHPRTPPELAQELSVNAKTLRAWLRRTFPRSANDHGAQWELTAEQVEAARQRFSGARPLGRSVASGPAATAPAASARAGRAASDEAYVIDLCDELLGERANRQHRFSWLLGDPGRNGGRVRLPVDAFYPQVGVVVEYRERQHERATPFFDKPDRMTVSGVDRGEQRRLYDQRRETEIPRHGLRLLIVRADDLACDLRGRLYRLTDNDREVLRRLFGGCG